MKKIDFESHYYVRSYIDAASEHTGVPHYDKKTGIMYHGNDGFLPIGAILSRLLELGEQRLKDLDEAGVDYRIVFLDCRDEILERRYNETRRRHPLSDDISTGIRMEREMLAELRDRASVIIDTTNMRPLELGTALERELNMGSTGFMLRVMSFGYKRGVPFEADIVLDMRFSSNPYYDKELRPLCGKDKAIRDYVMADKDVREFMDNVESMLYRLIPRFIEQDKRRLVVAFGCTGGRHRSVCAAEELYNRIKGRYNAVLTHRDLTIEGSDIKERTGDKS